MIRLDEVVALVGGIQAAELERWCMEGWVRPEREQDQWRFGEIDVARVRLICELKVDLAIDEDALPVVLDLMDQVHGLRARLAALARALAAEPPEVRRRIAAAIAREEDARSARS
jgi:chaperone modulatory protein CbpM